jgi:hypothetical protein
MDHAWNLSDVSNEALERNPLNYCTAQNANSIQGLTGIVPCLAQLARP